MTKPKNAPADLLLLLALLPGSWHFCSMEVTLPKPLDERLSPKDAALHLAIGLFVSDEATLGQAAQTAGLSQTEFLRELGRRRIPIHYGEKELHMDLESIESLVTQ